MVKREFLEFLFDYHYLYLHAQFKSNFSIFGQKMQKLEKMP